MTGIQQHQDYLALLRAVLTTPADDLPRLVLADWLEERGEADRAEFIRVQVELEPIRYATIGDQIFRQAELRARESALLAAHARDWLGDLNGLPPWWSRMKGLGWQCVPDGAVYAVFRRGFVAEVTCRAADWLRHARALFWSPKQTVECDGGCCGTGVRTVWAALSAGNWSKTRTITCPECKGAGDLPRAFPPTAHPLTRVTLTTPVYVVREQYARHLTLSAHDGAAPTSYRTRVRQYPRLTGNPASDVKPVLELEWPGVEFTLPPPDPRERGEPRRGLH